MVGTTPGGQQQVANARAHPVAQQFAPSVAADPLFECSTARWFRARVGPAALRNYERIAYDLVIAPTQGRGTHDVDFETARLDRHHWLYVRAGQAHRWGPSIYEADLILLQPAAGTIHWQPGPRVITFTDDQLADVASLLEFAKIERSRPDPQVMAATRELLFGWLRLGAPSERLEPLCINFRNLLEVRVVDVRTVDRYASMLGCSPKELTAACRRAGCAHPKKMIDAALHLEAKRLLCQANASPPAVASFLDFDDRQFARFFKRHERQGLESWMVEHLSHPVRG